MKISQDEIRNVAAAYRDRNTQIIPFPSRPDIYSQPLWWARAIYDFLPPLRDTLVVDLRARITEGSYHVPAELIVEQLLGRLFIDRIAS